MLGPRKAESNQREGIKVSISLNFYIDIPTSYIEHIFVSLVVCASNLSNVCSGKTFSFFKMEKFTIYGREMRRSCVQFFFQEHAVSFDGKLRDVTRTLIGEGGGVCSYNHVLSDGFLLNLS